MPPPATATMTGDQRVAWGGGLVDRQAGQELGLLGERPPGHDRRDGEGRGEARELESPAEYEPERRDARRTRHDHGREPRPGDQLAVERMGVALQDAEPGEGEQAGDRAGAERAPPIGSHEVMLSAALRVVTQVDGGQVGGDRDCQRADDRRGRVEPARHQIPFGLAVRDSSRRDATDARTERERRHDRRDGGDEVERREPAADPTCRPTRRTPRRG